ncbi:Wzz/FepE/Etk N-terminal domain-containing protein [Gallaecimonas mangrovi]|uniref:Wzz/FepE/Etk N-terminal domain-containing protein n=1 Tax=Gallaecimonas mangrovi TaxID=2291597 RepID=UPI000E209040|nr:Wzz/FepE/Etk N-terminal domain-containing protein [Gallaecimonas mangrovi]
MNEEKEFFKNKMMTHNTNVRPLKEGEVDLKDLFILLWRSKVLILIISAVCAIGGYITSKFMPEKYQSQALISPVSTDQNSSSIMGQLGSIASIAGLSMGTTGTVDQTTLALQILQSRQFISNFILKHKILATLMATNSWDAKRNSFEYNLNIYNPKNEIWLKNKNGMSLKPSLVSATNYFLNKVMTVAPDSEASGMTTVSVSFYSPVICRQWVEWLISDLNETMRMRDMKDAKNSIAYLNGQLESTTVADTRAMLYQLIEQKTTTLMLTQVRREYAFQTVDPAVTAEHPSSPKPKLALIVGFILGLFLSVLYVLIRNAIKRD